MKRGSASEISVDTNWYDTPECDGSNLDVNSS